jgi:hypothetical protein
MALPVKKTKKGDPPDVNPKKSDPDYKEDVKENAGAKKSNLVTANEVHGAIKAFADKKKQMSSKARKRVAGRLKAMKAGAK